MNPAFRLSPKHIESIRLNPNISKYWEFRELKVLGLDTKSDMTSKYVTNFFISIRHYKREDFEIDADRMVAGSLQDFPPHKYVPTILVGIPVVIHTLVVPSPGVSVTVAEPMSRDLLNVSECCDVLGMKLNAGRVIIIIIIKKGQQCKAGRE